MKDRITVIIISVCILLFCIGCVSTKPEKVLLVR